MLTRLPKLILVLLLLGATAAAFAVTERLKLEQSPIRGTRVDDVFSPVCECARDVAVISFVLRRSETVTVDLLDAAGESVRTLVRDRDEPRGRVSYTWDGRDDAEQIVPEGRYRPRVRLRDHGRTIVLPNPITVDTTAPRIRIRRVSPRVFSPDGDRRRDRVVVLYEIDERARAMLLVDGRRRVLSRLYSTEGRLAWHGEVRRRSARPGVYELRLRATDPAGNRGSSRRAVPVVVRYVALTRDRIEVVAGRRFRVGVLTDAVSYRWHFAGRSGTGRLRRLTLRAPETAGEYRVFAIVGRYADRAEVIVTDPPEQPVP